MLLVAVMIVGGIPVRALAVPGFDHDVGNGRNNRNSVAVNSPEFNRGIQHVTNTNVDGNNITEASFCKWRLHHCRLSQRAKIFGH